MNFTVRTNLWLCFWILLWNQLGRYSVIGFQPYMQFKEENGIFYKNDVPQEGSIEQALKQYLRENREENPTHLPLVSGGLGIFFL